MFIPFICCIFLSEMYRNKHWLSSPFPFRDILQLVPSIESIVEGSRTGAFWLFLRYCAMLCGCVRFWQNVHFSSFCSKIWSFLFLFFLNFGPFYICSSYICAYYFCSSYFCRFLHLFFLFLRILYLSLPIFGLPIFGFPIFALHIFVNTYISSSYFLSYYFFVPEN